MATVTAFTAERMLEIENNSVVDGDVVGDDLILTRQGGGTINAGSVRGPTGSPGVSSGDLTDQLADQMEDIEDLILEHAPIGAIVDYINGSPPPRWLFLNGQTITNAQTLNTVLWSRAPTIWRSGANLVLPDARGRVTVCYDGSDPDFDPVGEVGGSKTHALTIPELPGHTHTINHDHASVTSGLQSQNHEHTINHDHGSFTSSAGSAHQHGAGTLVTGIQIGSHTHAAGGSQPFAVADSSSGGLAGPGPYSAFTVPNVTSATAAETGNHTHTISGSTGNESAHTHTIDVPNYTGSSGLNSHSHDHVVDIPNYAGSSGSTGSGTAHNNLQPYVVFVKIIKVL